MRLCYTLNHYSTYNTMPRNAEQNEAMKRDRRQKILAGALRLFAENGLAATKIADIARATGMAQGLVYHYYDSKDAIFTDIIRTAFTKLNQACDMLQAMAGRSSDKLRLAATGLIRSLTENEDSALNHLLIAQATASHSIPAEARKVILAENRKPYQTMEKLFRQIQAEGDGLPGEPADLSRLFWTTINGIAIYKASHGAKSFEPNVSIIMRMFLKETIR